MKPTGDSAMTSSCSPLLVSWNWSFYELVNNKASDTKFVTEKVDQGSYKFYSCFMHPKNNWEGGRGVKIIFCQLPYKRHAILINGNPVH